MKIVISHPTSNQLNRKLVKALFEENMLQEFHTTFATFPDDIYDKLSTIGPFRELKRRGFDKELRPYTHTHIWNELGRILALKTNLNGLTKHEKGFFSIHSIYQKLDKKLASQMEHFKESGADAIYSYEDGALESFTMAQLHGLQCMYDLPIGYWRTAQTLLSAERERWPEWAQTIMGLKDSPLKLKQKDAELALADRIFVGSTFVAKTLKDYPGKLAPIDVIPYGFPKVSEMRSYSPIRTKKKLKLLFVGSLSQRKGIADIFAVSETLKDYVTLTVIGGKPTNNCMALNTALTKHHWIPGVPHAELLKIMRSHDILVFPSLFEGFGLVIAEAMSQGTPVITTDRTGGPDLIKHNKNGWLIKAASTAALQKCIEDILMQPEKVQIVGKAAQESAKLRPWEVYTSEMVTAIRNFKSN